MGRMWPYQANCKNPCDENNIDKTRLNAVKILFYADRGSLAAINEVCCNRNTMSSSYHFLGTQEATFSSLLASIWSFVLEFWPIGQEEKGIISLLDMAPKTAGLILHPLSLRSLASWMGGMQLRIPRRPWGHRQNHKREGF